MASSIIFGERSLTKIAALFDQAMDARVAAERVVRDGRLPLKRVLIVGPSDRALGRKLEPEDEGIFWTLVKAHVRLGAGGLVFGLLFGWLLLISDLEFATASPYYTVGVAGMFGLIAGLLLGGLVTLRPDHTVLITRVKEGLGRGQWAVLVHPTSRDQGIRAVNVLEHCGGAVIETL
jgi:hypothetical protein